MEVARWRSIGKFPRELRGAFRATIAIPTQPCAPFLVYFLAKRCKSIAYINICTGNVEKALRFACQGADGQTDRPIFPQMAQQEVACGRVNEKYSSFLQKPL